MTAVRRGRSPRVVDTNVLIVANRREKQRLACAAKCAAALNDLTHSGVVVLDTDGLIFQEYRGYLNFSGQPGAGDAFFRWLCNNRYRADLCHLVKITSSHEQGVSFSEFPDHADLADFDPADRKFVAVSNAHPEKPPILQAVDSKWLGWQAGLNSCGITVHFICPQEIAALNAG